MVATANTPAPQPYSKTLNNRGWIPKDLARVHHRCPTRKHAPPAREQLSSTAPVRSGVVFLREVILRRSCKTGASSRLPPAARASTRPAGQFQPAQCVPVPRWPGRVRADNLSLTWNSLQPLRPSARLTNIDSMAIWQQWLVAAGIGLGIGGSLLASLLFEWARWQPSTSASGVLLVKPSVERSVFVPTEAASRAKTECPWVVTVLILFVAAILDILRRMISGRMGG